MWTLITNFLYTGKADDKPWNSSKNSDHAFLIAKAADLAWCLDLAKKTKLQAVLCCDFGWSLDKLLPNNVANIDILKRPTMRRQYTMMPDIESYT